MSYHRLSVLVFTLLKQHIKLRKYTASLEKFLLNLTLLVFLIDNIKSVSGYSSMPDNELCGDYER